jgi:hypothetical protein
MSELSCEKMQVLIVSPLLSSRIPIVAILVIWPYLSKAKEEFNPCKGDIL